MSAESELELSIIIVNYNTKELTGQCISSIMDSIPYNFNYEILVVDNNSKDESVKYLNELYNHEEKVFIIPSDQNVGFGGGNNLAAKHAKGSLLLFINSDTYIKKININNLINVYRETNNIGALSCKILNPDNSIQTLGFKFPSVFNDFKLCFLFWNFNFVKKIRFANYTNKGLFKSDWVSGAFFICDKVMFNSINGFDSNIFMYAEDLDLCVRLHKLGKDNYIYDYEQIYHIHGKSSSLQLRRLIDSKKSYLYVLKKNNINKFPNLIYSMHVIHALFLWIIKTIIIKLKS
ncbi:hypothetical protein A7K91_21315 [Paenibacillus oryzae]|uniref:Glycosyltransferase 2-like domain-containing protein n=1 Tax=Paenibacillus oryzae TaxID=1844972 RepID=A0A1A5YS85_9BACL|nr:glycosyltransferase family 2 protein [Paenibacillus oryzae]OBR68423.1 hypothetical protein A7K91_21315 [Paenibacillus oryzae]